MSDGYLERMNDNREMLDSARARSAFEAVATQAPQEIVDHRVKSCDEWANGRPQDDDVTFVVIKCAT